MLLKGRVSEEIATQSADAVDHLARAGAVEPPVDWVAMLKGEDEE
jgi:hypothetical protein